MLHQPLLAAVNHLLAQSGWAMPRLARFGGKTLYFHIAPFSFACKVHPDGTLVASDAGAEASFRISPLLLPRLASQDETAFRQIECSGESSLISEFLFIARNLRWDLAEDLSRIVGDIASERLVQFALGSHKMVRETALNLSHAAVEYWVEEHPLLAQPHAIADFISQVHRFEEDLSGLDQRISRLSQN